VSSTLLLPLETVGIFGRHSLGPYVAALPFLLTPLSFSLSLENITVQSKSSIKVKLFALVSTRIIILGIRKGLDVLNGWDKQMDMSFCPLNVGHILHVF
jgi:hypothetical protein